MPRPCHVLRVFTRDGDGGNALGVINDLTELDGDGMQQIAADLGFSESVFIEWPPGEPPFVRIFTPVMELPFAGHPLVGTAWVMSSLGPGGVDRVRCGIGEVSIRMEEDEAWIDLSPHAEVSEAEEGPAIAAEAQLPPPLHAWWVRLPKEYLLLEVDDFDDVANARPVMEPLSRHFGTLLFARHNGAVKARFFAPAAGVDEDPATGSAAVALAMALRHRGEHDGALKIEQGDELGHPSTIRLRWDEDSVSVGGQVVRDEVRFLEV